MWNDPAALNRLSGLIVLGVVLFAAWLGARSLVNGHLPFHRVTVLGADHAATRQAARAMVPGLSGGFFSMDLNRVRSEFERLPWVRHADVRRLWPNRLEVHLEEHRPAAAWNDRVTLDTYGALFAVEPSANLPHFYAPDGLEQEVARQYGEFSRQVAPLGMRIDQLVVTRRLSWRVRLSGGISVELGRERMGERLARFVSAYPQALSVMGAISRADMRYPNGFAARGTGSGQRKQPA